MCQALLHGHRESVVILHDFDRHGIGTVILDVADVVEQVDSLVVFKRKPGATQQALVHMWQAHMYDRR